MAVHQSDKFSTNPNHSNHKEVKRIDRHLKGSKDKSLILKPNLKKDLEIFVDADFVGACDKYASEDPSTAHSRAGFVIK